MLLTQYQNSKVLGFENTSSFKVMKNLVFAMQSLSISMVYIVLTGLRRNYKDVVSN